MAWRVHGPAGAPWDTLGGVMPAPVVCMGPTGYSYTQMISMGSR